MTGARSARGELRRGRRIDYELVRGLLAKLEAPEQAASLIGDAWAAQYRAESTGETEVVEVELGTLTYLFDIANERVVGVHGRSAPTNAVRPAARMRGHPSYNKRGEEQTDRGHLVAHTIGGGTDINLVPQARALNVSAGWRAFERYLQEHAGAFFVVQVEYGDESQRPFALVYGVLRDDGAFQYERFLNR